MKADSDVRFNILIDSRESGKVLIQSLLFVGRHPLSIAQRSNES